MIKKNIIPLKSYTFWSKYHFKLTNKWLKEKERFGP